MLVSNIVSSWLQGARSKCELYATFDIMALASAYGACFVLLHQLVAVSICLMAIMHASEKNVCMQLKVCQSNLL